MRNKLLLKVHIHKLLNTGAEWFSGHRFAEFFVFAVFIVFFSEILNQRSFLQAAEFMIFSFPTAILNIAIVFSMLVLTLLMRKKRFWKYFIVVFWIVISVVSFVMYSFRMMPFSFMDILLIPGTFTVFPVYLSVWQMVLIALVLLGLIAGIICIYRKSEKTEINFSRGTAFFLLSVIFTFLYLLICRESGFVDDRITGLTVKYRTNGFVYCFSSSVVDMGMSVPDEYSDSKIVDVMNQINDNDADAMIEANVVFVQLESFFDINSVEGIDLSENPLPVFTNLKKDYSHGYLNVPTYSAGTANTEFEILTGMNTDYFGIGEFPYQTIAEKQPIESVAHIMTKNGYKNHALHNNSAKFYNRDVVYSNLGFDTFTSLEYMYNVKYNSMGWAKDSALVSGIKDAINSTKERDFVYAVSVQTHGVYPDDTEESQLRIKVSGVKDEKKRKQYSYYVNELYETDTFIGTLISELDTVSEPTVIVVFGDHLPGIEPESANAGEEGNIYRTEYLMWSNFETDFIIKDIESYQLYSYVLDRLNHEGGAISRLHRNYKFSQSEEYMNNFELLQYYMLYEDGDSGVVCREHKPTELKFGVRDISVSDVNFVADIMYVHGKNFNEFSKVFCDDDKFETVYIDKHTLSVENIDINDITSVRVGQVDSNSNILSYTNEVIPK